MRPCKRRLSDDERSVLLSELLLRHPELVAEAEEITSTLLVVENDQELADEITVRLRALRHSGPVSVDTGRRRVLTGVAKVVGSLRVAVTAGPLHLKVAQVGELAPELLHLAVGDSAGSDAPPIPTKIVRHR